MTDLILASASPRRRELLGLLEISFDVQPADVDERLPANERDVGKIAEELARQKARAIVPEAGETPVLAADTIVALDGQLLGKPQNADEAREMLERLRGREHIVVTGVALSFEQEMTSFHATTEVVMRDYDPAAVEASIERGDPFDKAGGYAIQDPIFRPVALYRGCYTNVVGLPVGGVAYQLMKTGILSQVPTPIEERPPCACCPWIEAP